MCEIEQRFGAKPASFGTAQCFIGEFSILLVDFHCLVAASSCRSIGHELCMTALFEAPIPKVSWQEEVYPEDSSLHKPENSRFNRFANRE